MPLATPDARLHRLAQAYEGLRADNLPGLLALYSEAARFKDPFNDVRGHPAITRVFAHMFTQLEQPRFRVHQAASTGDQGFLLWTLDFRRSNGQVLEIEGSSHLQFAADGRLDLHRDYWDPCEELYARMPVLGGLARWLQRRLRAPQ